VLEAFEFLETKDAHELHLALLGSVGEWTDGPLAEVWEMPRGRYLCSMCVRGTELPNYALEKLAAG